MVTRNLFCLSGLYFMVLGNAIDYMDLVDVYIIVIFKYYIHYIILLLLVL